ncbi:hypothetical protein ANANG_G00270160 [Anguilla anguilla]|uniref:C2H2-type domain-containing protein n=1 Tax=Anguilla anguilla TaxID=7936 RepID=A0A9D3LUW0_ANGAN|nr:hypothetical protein ANANG_G00270160 [Anguilla anguilla]
MRTKLSGGYQPGGSRRGGGVGGLGDEEGAELQQRAGPESSSPAEICVIIGESHNAQTPGSYVCGICGKKYKYYNCFQTHVRGHRESDGGSGEGGSQSTINNFRYTCDICGKKYKYYSCFQEHRDLHSVDDPYDQVVIPVDDSKEEEPIEPFLKIGPKTGIYVCEFCGKQYKYFNPYQEHVALHAPLSHSFEMQSPRAPQRLKDSRKHGNMKSDQIESPFSRKMEKKSQSTLGETNSSQNSSGAMCPLVSSSFPPPQTDSENHSPAGTINLPAPPPPPRPRSSRGSLRPPRRGTAPLTSAAPCRRRSGSNAGGHGGAARAYPLGRGPRGRGRRLAGTAPAARSYNQAKVKVTCALGRLRPAWRSAARPHGRRPALLPALRPPGGGAAAPVRVLGARELDPGRGRRTGRGGDEQLQQWAQNVLSEFVMPEARATYVTEPGAGLGWGGWGWGGAEPVLRRLPAGGRRPGRAGQEEPAGAGLGEIADLLDTCRHRAAAAGLPWDGPEDQAPPRRPPRPRSRPAGTPHRRDAADGARAPGADPPGPGQEPRRGAPPAGPQQAPAGGAGLPAGPPPPGPPSSARTAGPRCSWCCPPTCVWRSTTPPRRARRAPPGSSATACWRRSGRTSRWSTPTRSPWRWTRGSSSGPPPPTSTTTSPPGWRGGGRDGGGGDERADGEAESPPGKRGGWRRGRGGAREARKEVFRYLAEAAPGSEQPAAVLARGGGALPAAGAPGALAAGRARRGRPPELAAACRQAVAMRGQQRLTADQMNKLIFLKSNTA